MAEPAFHGRLATFRHVLHFMAGGARRGRLGVMSRSPSPEEEQTGRAPHVLRPRKRANAGQAPATGDTVAGDPADGPRGASALTRALGVQERAAVLGFDWPDARGPVACVREETNEAAALLLGSEAGDGGEAGPGRRGRLAEEVGDLLFAAVNLARAAGVEPRAALNQATNKFERRLARVRELAETRGVPMPGASLERLDRLWDEAKAEEAAAVGASCAAPASAPGDPVRLATGAARDRSGSTAGRRPPGKKATGPA